MTRELRQKKVVIRDKEITFTFLNTKNAVVIAPYTKEGKIILVRQIRPAVDEILLELPAGGIETGEEPLLAAKRELAEETGYQAKSIEMVSAFYASPGITNEKLFLYIAEVNGQSEQQLDDGEEIEIEEYTLTEAWSLVEKGEIRDGKTIVGLSLLRLRGL